MEKKEQPRVGPLSLLSKVYLKNKTQYLPFAVTKCPFHLDHKTLLIGVCHLAVRSTVLAPRYYLPEDLRKHYLKHAYFNEQY